jgi:phosphoglycerate dehydrogenase-like enzyme
LPHVPLTIHDQGTMKLAILDDYQAVGETIVDWGSVPGLEVVSFSDHVEDEAVLIERLASFDAIMRIRERTVFTASLLAGLPKLKLLLATGMRNSRSLDLAATDAQGITVCATGGLHESTVDVVWLLILSLFREFPGEIESFRNGGWQRGLGRGLADKTLGVLGLGNMGTPVATIAQCFGMEVIAWSPNLTPERAESHGVACVSKEELFSRADAITIHMPLVAATEGIVGAADLARMKPDAFLINTSRSGLVDQEALIAMLSENRIGGAGLDVFDIEPLPADHPYRTLPNVVASPHIGFVTRENWEIFFAESLENLKAFLVGAPIRRITADAPFLPDTKIAQQRGVKG